MPDLQKCAIYYCFLQVIKIKMQIFKKLLQYKYKSVIIFVLFLNEIRVLQVITEKHSKQRSII